MVTDKNGAAMYSPATDTQLWKHDWGSKYSTTFTGCCFSANAQTFVLTGPNTQQLGNCSSTLWSMFGSSSSSSVPASYSSSWSDTAADYLRRIMGY
jgi:hypothetical protein